MARADPRWVERDVRGYELSEAAPWTFSLYYGDGSRLVIPLSRIWFGEQPGPSATCFRRHKATGRLVPFAVTLSGRDPTLASLPHEDAVVRIAVPRFDTKLTPLVTQALHETQIVFAAEGIFTALKWQAMNPVLMGPPVAAPAAVMRRSVAAAGAAPASRVVPGGGLAAHEVAGGHLLAKHAGLTEAQLAERLAREGLERAGSFFNHAVAEQSVSEAIQANQAAISAWLKGTTERALVLEYMARSPVGQVLLKGVSKAVETCRFKLVLVKGSSSLGWLILTGYPVP